MKEACKSFGGGTLKKGVAKGLPLGFTIPGEIRELADTFVDLQEKRHLADDDLTERFQRSEILTLISEVRRRSENFRNLPPSNEKRFFLACLWAWKELANRCGARANSGPVLRGLRRVECGQSVASQEDSGDRSAATTPNRGAGSAGTPFGGTSTRTSRPAVCWRYVRA